jgi:hypothetical protein
LEEGTRREGRRKGRRGIPSGGRENERRDKGFRRKGDSKGEEVSHLLKQGFLILFLSQIHLSLQSKQSSVPSFLTDSIQHLPGGGGDEGQTV